MSNMGTDPFILDVRCPTNNNKGLGDIARITARVQLDHSNVDIHANILGLFLTLLCPRLCVHMYCARAQTSVHKLYSIELNQAIISLVI